jgi:hypothetical protein
MSSRYPGGVVRKTAANTSITGASGVWDLGSQAQAVRNNTWPISGLANPVSGSLRFRSSASATLTRSVPGVNTTQLTFSCWFKYGVNANDNVLFSTQNNSSNYLYIGLNSSFALDVQIGATANRRITTQVFRDPSAWYHLVVTFDSTQATAANRIRIYVNGSEVTAFSTSTTGMSQNANLPSISSTLTNYIGGYNGSAGFYFDGYMAEINCVYSQALTPSSFGQTSPITGVWEPIKYTGTYGTNGFYLSLSDTSSIGKDFSGNGNNWTRNNISTANDSTFDLMRDVPTQYTPQGVTDVGGTVRGNYCVMSPIASSPLISLTNGNLTAGGTDETSLIGTIGVNSGKWYWEVTLTSGSYTPYLGVSSNPYDKSGVGTNFRLAGISWYGNGYKKAYTGTSESSATSNTTGVYGFALDISAGTLAYYFNNSLVFTDTTIPTSGVTLFPLNAHTNSGSNSWNPANFNFGQQPFAYTPPSGYKTLCTTNLSTPTIGATAANAANKYFDATLYTGNGAASGRNIETTTSPNLAWIKSRSLAANHFLFDSVRGATNVLGSNQTIVEYSNSDFGLGTNQFTVGDNGGSDDYNPNKNAATYVAWLWAAGGAAVTNTAGTISSQVSANPTSGFSIVTYTGTSANATVGHGLGVAPSMLITKPRSSADNWISWHTALGGTGYFYLDLTNASATAATVWNSTTPTSTVFSLGANGGVNASGVNFVAYCFAQVAGYSAFGSYTGNLNADGPFAYTGFRPKFIMWKRSDSTGDWIIFDTARDTYNYAQNQLIPNTSGAEAVTGGGFVRIDLLSNGFKIRSTDSYVNASGGTYIYMAFAEHPFKNALAR